MSKFIASIDVGTTNIKINLFNEGYDVIDSVRYAHYKIHNTDEIFEMDMDEIWINIVGGLRKLIELHNIVELEVILTTAMHSVQLMELDFELSGRLVTWADTRGSEALDRVPPKERETYYYRTGTPNHSMNPYYKLLEIYENGKLVGSLKDVLFYRLTGEWMIDISNASSSGLLNLETNTWDDKSLNAIGVTEAMLPTIQPVSYNTRSLSTLFDADVTVSIGTSDGISSNYAFNDLENIAVLSIGTSHAVRVVSERIQLNNKSQNFVYTIDEGHYLIGLPSNNGADVLSWANKVFNSTFEELNEVALVRPKTNSIFIPHLNGERAPIWNEFATGKLINLTRVSTRESVLFSIILGMLFNIKHNVNKLSELVEFEAIGLIGGVTELDAFPQLIADILGYTLYIPKIKNAETLGSIAVVRNMSFKSEYRVVVPNTEYNYDAMFEQYLKIVE